MDIELIRSLEVNAKTSETCGSVRNAFPQNSHKNQGPSARSLWICNWLRG